MQKVKYLVHSNAEHAKAYGVFGNEEEAEWFAENIGECCVSEISYGLSEKCKFLYVGTVRNGELVSISGKPLIENADSANPRMRRFGESFVFFDIEAENIEEGKAKIIGMYNDQN